LLKNNHTNLIKQWTRDLGFDHCGIARAEVLDDDARRLESWLNKGMNGSMSYMENYFDIRIDPSKLVPGAKSVITLLLNYFPGREESAGHLADAGTTAAQGAPRIAKYAYGKDYHEVIRSKLKELLERGAPIEPEPILAARLS